MILYSPWRHWPSVLWKQRPIQLTFFVTRRCNARCPYCFYLRGEHAHDETAPELNLEEIKRISRSLGNLLWLAFSGGEVYLRKDLVEISHIFYRRNRPAIMLYPTNGLMPDLIARRTEQILQRCPRSVITVKLSIDGLYDDHDRLRATPGSFAKTLRTYEQLCRLQDTYANLELGVNTVFLSRNQDNMDAIIDFVSNMQGVPVHTVSLARGALRDPSYKDIDMAKYRHAAARLAAMSADGHTYRFRGARLKAALDVLQRRLIHDTVEAKRRLIDCYAGRANLVLTETGDLYPCEIRNDSFGNVRDYDYDVNAACRTNRARRTLGSIANQECYCSHECYFMTNILLNPTLYPQLAREYRHLKRA